MEERSKTINEKSCGILIIHDEDYLLLHYPQGHWDFVKGHVEPDEKELETALRELEEESGISKVDVVDGFREEMHYFFKHEGQLISKTVVYFLATVGDREVKISHEHQNFDWLPFKAAKERLTFKNAKEILEKAYNFLV